MNLMICRKRVKGRSEKMAMKTGVRKAAVITSWYIRGVPLAVRILAATFSGNMEALDQAEKDVRTYHDRRK